MRFQAKMQVISTLWSEINSSTNQNTSLGSNGPKEAQLPKQIHLRQGLALGNRTRSVRTAHQRELGAVGAMARPADQAHGPHRLNFAMWLLLTGSQSRFYKDQLQFGRGSLL